MKRLKFKILLVIYLLVLSYLCFWHFTSLPQAAIEIIGIPADKIVHFLMFLPLPLLLYWAFNWPYRKWWYSILLGAGLLAAGSAVAYGTEYLQGLTDYRTYDPLDFKADVMALTVASAAVCVLNLSKLHRYEH